MLQNRYHLPHNSVRIDEFNHMLESVDLNNEYYLYEDLRLLFLKTQIKDDKLKLFHKAYDQKLANHTSEHIRDVYKKACEDPSDSNLKELLECQYTPRKTFKQVFNETVRDYTEFFAFLGLLTTYYKGRTGGEKRHYVTQRLKDYRNGFISLKELLLEFKFRNSSKDYESIQMYSITVRPFCIALKALKYYFDKGFQIVTKGVLSAVVTYAHDDNIQELLDIFNDPTLKIEQYENVFDTSEFSFKNIKEELNRATLLLNPYLKYMGYITSETGYYKKKDPIPDNLFTTRSAFCNCYIGKVALTPVIGKILYCLYSSSKHGVSCIKRSDLFDSNVSEDDRVFLLNELKDLGCIKTFDLENILISPFENQFSIDPYTEFFEIDDCDYVKGAIDLSFSAEEMIIQRRNLQLESALNDLKPIALGSDGSLYEKSLYELIKNNFQVFDTIWYGANSTGKRLSDIVIRTKIRDDHEYKNILIIIECKAGNAIRAFDERKEMDDIERTLAKEKDSGTSIDGVWYWVVDSNSLPNVDEHGGYRSNQDSRSFIEKLNSIQFDVSEYMRVPTIVTAFSYEAIRSYITYLSDKIGSLNNTAISKVDAPHFWRWSKKFMNLQYVMVHRELRLSV